MDDHTPGLRRRAIGAIAIVGLISAACTSAASPSSATTAPPPSAAAPAPSAAAANSAPAAGATPAIVAMDTFHKVDGEASGSVALENLADGTIAVVVWLHPLDRRSLPVKVRAFTVRYWSPRHDGGLNRAGGRH